MIDILRMHDAFLCHPEPIKGHKAHMTANERMMKICAASPALLAKIDAVLVGDETVVPKVDPDLRTCTITEAARRYQVSRPTMYRLIQAGRVRTLQLNGVSRVLIQSLVDYANGRAA